MFDNDVVSGSSKNRRSSVRDIIRNENQSRNTSIANQYGLPSHIATRINNGE
ncbi:MAG: hypothetical protein MHPSP_001912, partial [Paramarteilia canceri]